MAEVKCEHCSPVKEELAGAEHGYRPLWTLSALLPKALAPLELCPKQVKEAEKKEEEEASAGEAEVAAKLEELEAIQVEKREGFFELHRTLTCSRMHLLWIRLPPRRA